MTSETDNKVEAAVIRIYEMGFAGGVGKTKTIATDDGVIGAHVWAKQEIRQALASLDRTAPGETPKVCVLCGAPNANPRPWDQREPVCPDCQDSGQRAALPAQEVAGLVEGDLEWLCGAINGLRTPPIALETFKRERPRLYRDRLEDGARIDRILTALASSPSQGGETVDRSGVAAADNNHKALAEGVLQVQSDLQMLARACQENDPKAEIAIRISDALDVIQDRIAPLLAAFTTKGMDQ